MKHRILNFIENEKYTHGRGAAVWALGVAWSECERRRPEAQAVYLYVFIPEPPHILTAP